MKNFDGNSKINKDNVKNEKLKETIKNILDDPFAQAIVKIFYSKNLSLKIFLVIFVLVNLCLTSYMVINVIMEYFSYNVVTTSRTVFEIPTKFPQITICNYNMFTSKYSLDFLKNFSETMKTLPTDVNIFEKNEVNNISYSSMMPKIAKFYKTVVSYVNSQNFSDENKKKLGHSLKHILFNCKFNTITCDLNEFTWEFDPVYGNCYKFNSGFNSTGGKVEIKESNIAGPINGLQFDLFVNVNEDIKEYYYSYLNSDINTVNFNALGAIIKIDNSSFLIDHSFNGGIKIASGFHTDLSIYRNININLPKPYSNCELENTNLLVTTSKQDSLINKFSNSSFQYSQQLCVIQCFQSNIIKKCNCSYPKYFSIFDVEVCQNSNKISCAEQEWRSNSLQGKINNCLALCPLECNQTFYQTKLSVVKTISWKYYHSLIGKNLASVFSTLPIGPEKALESFVSLNIFYESLSYSLTTESPQMDSFSLLAEIGGHMGLILGVSVFSSCQVIELLIELFFLKRK